MMKRWISAFLAAFVALAIGAPARSQVTVPNIFAGQSGTIPLSELDANFALLAAATPINVKQAPYNATCNGSADDTAAIQAALTYVAAHGGILTTPAGARCEVTGVTATWNSHAFIIQGAGGDASNGGSQWDYTGAANGSALTLVASDQVVGILVRDMAIYNASSNAANGIKINNIDPGSVRLERMWISGFSVGSTDAAVLVTGPYPGASAVTNFVWVEGGRFSSNSYGVLATVRTVNNIYIHGTMFNANTTAVADTDIGSGSTIGEHWVIDSVGVVQSGSSSDVVLDGGISALYVTNSYFEHGGAYGQPAVYVTNGSATNAAGVVIEGDTFNMGISSTGAVIDVHGTVNGLRVGRNTVGSTGGTAAMVNFNSGTITNYIVEMPATLAGSTLGSTTINPSSTATIVSDFIGSAGPAVAYNTNSATSGATLTAANVIGGSAQVSLNMTGTLSGAANAQLPTVAALVTALEAAGVSPLVGKSYELDFMNSSSGAYAWTVTTNTGWTLTGTMTAAQNTYRKLYVTLTSLTAATLQSVGQYAIGSGI